MSIPGILANGQQWRVEQGDVREVLGRMPDGCVQTVVTSPPYWGLRDYNLPPLVWGGDAGCEHEWDESTRLIRNTNGTGASTLNCLKPGYIPPYHAQHAGTNARITTGFCRLCGAWRGSLGLEPTPEMYVEHLVSVFREIRRVLRDDGTCWINLGDGFQDKQLLGMPWRVAFALQADGWWLRSDVIWMKPNPMPESARDRPTKSHEHVFLLSKRARYYWDQDAVREKPSPFNTGKISVPPMGNHRMTQGARLQEIREYKTIKGRNIRDVWTIPTHPFPEAHFATFPPKLVEPCIKAGTSERGCCPECGKAWKRIIERTGHVNKREAAHVPNHSPTKTDSTGWAPTNRATERWRPGCECDAGDPVPCIVLDVFSGSGTTAMVALRLGRRAIGVDLSPKYVAMAKKRIVEDCPMFISRPVSVPKPEQQEMRL